VVTGDDALMRVDVITATYLFSFSLYLEIGNVLTKGKEL